MVLLRLVMTFRLLVRIVQLVAQTVQVQMNVLDVLTVTPKALAHAVVVTATVLPAK